LVIRHHLTAIRPNQHHAITFRCSPGVVDVTIAATGGRMTLALVVALLAAATPAALPATRPVLVVVVQQETRAVLEPKALKEIDRDVRQVWRPYADVALRPAGEAVAVAADDVLTLVITDRESDAGGGLGWIQFDGDRPSRTIYVSRTEVLRLGEQGRWVGRNIADWAKAQELFLRRAMTFAIAHEVGHYLLQSKAHAASGLMRARFTFDEMMRATGTKYRLGVAEQAILRQRMRGYLLARNGAVDAPMP